MAPRAPFAVLPLAFRLKLWFVERAEPPLCGWSMAAPQTPGTRLALECGPYTFADPVQRPETPRMRGNGSGKSVNRRGKGSPDRRAKGTPWLVTDRGGSVRPCGASLDCAAGASAVGLGADC